MLIKNGMCWYLGRGVCKDYSLPLRKEVLIWDKDTTEALAILLEGEIFGINKEKSDISDVYIEAFIEIPYLTLRTLSLLKVYDKCRGLG